MSDQQYNSAVRVRLEALNKSLIELELIGAGLEARRVELRQQIEAERAQLWLEEPRQEEQDDE